MNRLIEDIKTERRWTRKCLGILVYHKLQCANYDNVRGLKWTLEDTAKELGLSIGHVSESLKLAKALDFNKSLEMLTREKALEYLRLKKD